MSLRIPVRLSCQKMETMLMRVSCMRATSTRVNAARFPEALVMSSGGGSGSSALKLAESRLPIITSTSVASAHTTPPGGLPPPPIPIPAPIVDHNVYINAATGEKVLWTYERRTFSLRNLVPTVGVRQIRRYVRLREWEVFVELGIRVFIGRVKDVPCFYTESCDKCMDISGV